MQSLCSAGMQMQNACRNKQKEDKQSHLSNNSRTGWTNIGSGGETSGTTTKTWNVVAGCMDSVEVYFRPWGPSRGSRDVRHAYHTCCRLGYSRLRM